MAVPRRPRPFFVFIFVAIITIIFGTFIMSVSYIYHTFGPGPSCTNAGVARMVCGVIILLIEIPLCLGKEQMSCCVGKVGQSILVVLYLFLAISPLFSGCLFIPNIIATCLGLVLALIQLILIWKPATHIGRDTNNCTNQNQPIVVNHYYATPPSTPNTNFTTIPMTYDPQIPQVHPVQCHTIHPVAPSAPEFGHEPPPPYSPVDEHKQVL